MCVTIIPAKELWKRPEVPRDSKAFGPNSSGKTVHPPLHSTPPTPRPKEREKGVSASLQPMLLRVLDSSYKVRTTLGSSPAWLLFLKVSCASKCSTLRGEGSSLSLSAKASQLCSKLTLFEHLLLSSFLH